jgi:clan AA aspartic protease
MTLGVVSAALEARIPLLLHGSGGQSQLVDALIDTGYDGSLTLPSALIQSLQLPWVQRILGVLADGSQRHFDRYAATVSWNGQKRIIRIEEIDTSPMIGMRFLQGHELRIQVVQSGLVTVIPIP